MRSSRLRSAIAPSQGYVCFSCCLRNARYLHAANQRYQHTSTSPQAEEQIDGIQDGQSESAASRPLLGNEVQGSSSSKVIKAPTEAALRARQSKNLDGLEQQHTSNLVNSNASEQEPVAASALEREERPVDLKTRQKSPISKASHSTLDHKLFKRIPTQDRRAKDVSLEELAKSGKANPKGLLTLAKSLLPRETNANTSPSGAPSTEPSEKSIKKSRNNPVEKLITKEAKVADHTSTEGSKALSRRLAKERKAKLNEGLRTKVNGLRTSLEDAQRRDREMKMVARKSPGIVKRKTASKPTLRMVSSPPSVSAPRTVGSQKGRPTNVQTTSAAKLRIVPIDVEQPPVPGLAYGLDRVLFNPGVYQLQDPRSRVYNFDPYLQKLMPIADFNFNALKEYITSSKDESLQKIVRQQGKRYSGSTSSMSATLAHFHFLLSQWRSINVSMLSQSLPIAKNLSFTEIQRTPAAIFLRLKDGSYAIDADKQFDKPNVLSMLGKSMEKLLTLKTGDFERYRRSSLGSVTEEESTSPESFHYSTLGDFLMRSQLDAHDPRLPGTGMFDLKTRAVVSIRMDVENYELGTGYEIKSSLGEWESYEREYYDMIRAAFLKYSMQVRMGRMDGIFVAFHNVERIFGFQYVSLPEMDNTIHGQPDTTIGDQEFKLSLDLLNKILDRATQKFPNTSIRLHFETRDAATPFMYIFAQPVTEEQIDEIQNLGKAKIEEFERDVLGRGVGRDEGQGWEDIQAEVERAMDKDELALDETEESAQDRDEIDDQVIDDHNQLYANASGVDGENDIGEDDIGAVAAEDGDHLSSEDNGASLEEAEDDQEQDEEEEESEKDNAKEEDEDEDRDEDPEEEGEGSDETALPADGQRIVTLTEYKSAMTDGGSVEHVENNVVNQLPSDNLLPDNAENTESSSNYSELKETTTTTSTTSNPPPPPTTEEPPFTLPETSEESNTFSTEADQPFLDVLSASSPHSASSSDDDEGPDTILAMTLTLRNKINGQYVLRPTNMTPTDKWEVDYSLVEVPLQSRAHALYEACQVRREKKLARSDVPSEEEDEALSDYVIKLREMSKEGRVWRKELDEKDKERGKVETLKRDSTEDSGA